MKQEDKELLLKDLCARLPYNIKVVDDLGRCRYLTLGDTDLVDLFYYDVIGIEPTIKPYLRPMSSMTEEEAREWAKASNMQFDMEDGFFDCYDAYLSVDWLDKNMFDHRKNDNGKTLIEAGLALEAPAGMYNDKK